MGKYTFRKFEHPNWDTSRIDNDFSLLRLSSAVDFSNPSLSHVFPACWPTKAENPGDWVSKIEKIFDLLSIFDATFTLQSIISGWGRTSWGGSQPIDLKKVKLQE